MKRICSRRSNLIVNINKGKDWFKERGYPEEIVNKEANRALESSISISNSKSKKNTQGDREKGIPLMVTYYPFLCHLSETINVLETVDKSVKMLCKQTLSKIFWTKRFIRLTTDLYVMINV